MKTIFSIILLMIFITSNVGVIASSYTCKMTVEEMQEMMCCEKSRGKCCEKEVQLLKLKDDFISTGFQKIIKPFFSLTTALPYNLAEYTVLRPCQASSEENHPPPLEENIRLSFIKSYRI